MRGGATIAHNLRHPNRHHTGQQASERQHPQNTHARRLGFLSPLRAATEQRAGSAENHAGNQCERHVIGGKQTVGFTDQIERVRALDQRRHPRSQRGTGECERHRFEGYVGEQNLDREKRARKRRVIHARKAGRSRDRHQHASVFRIKMHPTREPLTEHRTQLARRHFSTDRHARTDNENLQQHMHDGLPNRHNIAIYRLFNGRHFRTARTQQPPNHGRDGRTRGHGNQSTNHRNVERAGFLRILNIAECKMLDAVQHQRQQTSGRTNGHSHNHHRRNQRRNSANLWLRSVRILRLLRFPYFLRFLRFPHLPYSPHTVSFVQFVPPIVHLPQHSFVTPRAWRSAAPECHHHDGMQYHHARQ